MASSTSTDAALDRLRQELGVRSVVERYFHAVDAYDAIALRSCFSDDAVFVHNAGGDYPREIVGGDAIAAYFHGRKRLFKARSHQLSHLSIVVDGEQRATCDTYGVAVLAFDETISVRGIHYLDTLVSDGDWQWRISKRLHSALWQYDVPSVPPFSKPPSEQNETP